MKRTIFLIVLLLILQTAIFAQHISGKVSDPAGQALSGASISLTGSYAGTLTDSEGEFVLNVKPDIENRLQISFIGFETEQISAKAGEVLTITLKKSEILTDEVTIHAYRTGESVPIAQSYLTATEIASQNTGKDVPYLLEMMPSVVANSDAGAGVGYTTLRIRGTDMTRINVTLDGIPLNDPESHGVWWVDLPDYASSVDNIQVQRGVGASTNGAAAFGANIVLKTNTLNKSAYGELSGSYGSFDTWKTTAKIGTGLINKHFVFDARLSKIHSDGFIDRARSDMESVFLTGAYTNKRNLLRINFTSGTEDTYQAWSGVPKDSLQTNRTYNPYTYENEIDHYLQRHFQIFYTHEFSPYFNVNTALHYTYGTGYYEQFMDTANPWAETAFADYGLQDVQIGDSVITNSNLIRRKWLENDFVGGIYSFDFHKNNLNLIFGGGYNQYLGNHFGRIIWAQYASNGAIRHEWYRSIGDKTDLNTYLKFNYLIFKKLNLWVDIQYRYITYTIDGTDDNGTTIEFRQIYPFFNPKAGVSYAVNTNQSIFLSYSLANREPARTDIVEADPKYLPKPETLYDLEAGYNYRMNQIQIQTNFYYMNYKNQLVHTGEINDVGGAVSENVPESYRAGFEFAVQYKPIDFFEWQANIALSRNKILNLTNYIDNYDTWGQNTETLSETSISFSPELIAANQFKFKINRYLRLEFNSKFVSRQYIDNSSNAERSIHPYFVNNAILGTDFSFWEHHNANINFGVNNVFNTQYETNAWVYRYIFEGSEYADYGYFPQAGRHYTVSLTLKFRTSKIVQ